MSRPPSDAVGFIAVDLGAESGRVMLARLKNGRLTLQEAHRFANRPQRLPSGLHWDLLGLWANIVEGLRLAGKAAKKRHIKVISIGVDTWGVDFGLLGRSGQLLGLPYAYRDDQHARAMAKTLRRVGPRVIYAGTGIQFMPINSLYQLVARRETEAILVTEANRLLLMPDLLHYFLTGRMVNEATIASTTQMVRPSGETGQWNDALLRKVGLPTRMLGRIVAAGTKIGPLTAAVVGETGLQGVSVVAPASHDTASAVAAVPVDVERTPRWAYLSSGTWSLLGAELDRPIVTDASRRAGFTNERGAAGTIRFLKNIAGLWLVQEVRRDLARRGPDLDYERLAGLAAAAQSFRTLIDPARPEFLSPGRMPAKIAAFARRTRQPVPTTPGQFVRCCLESLALTYRRTMDELEALLGCRFTVLHVVGGGGRNGLLNQMTADALDRPVIVGPFEATAIGNALTQAMGLGRVRNLAHLRAIVRASCKLQTFDPHYSAAFEAQYGRFRALRGR